MFTSLISKIFIFFNLTLVCLQQDRFDEKTGKNYNQWMTEKIFCCIKDFTTQIKVVGMSLVGVSKEQERSELQVPLPLSYNQ